MGNLRNGERKRNLRKGEKETNLTFLDLCPQSAVKKLEAEVFECDPFKTRIEQKNTFSGPPSSFLSHSLFLFFLSLFLSLFPNRFVPQILFLPLSSPTFLVIVTSGPKVRREGMRQERMRKEKFGIFFRFLFSFSNT